MIVIPLHAEPSSGSNICVPILPNQTHVKIFKNDIFAFYVSIHPYEAQKKVL